jgi:sulfur-carrier protein
MAVVTLRYWAAAKDAAGIAEEAVSAGTLAEALAAVSGEGGPGEGGPGEGGPGEGGRGEGGPGEGGPGGGHQRNERSERNARLRAILVRSSFLVDGNPVGTRAPEAVVLGDGAVVEVLPPFAGG